MSRGYKAAAVLLLAALGLWGCARGPAADADKVRTLENKCTKLEEDCRTVTAARDALRKQVAALEGEQTQQRQTLAAHQPLLKERLALIEERDGLVRDRIALGSERDGLLKEKQGLQQLIGGRTAERDEARTHLDTLRKGLRAVLGQADAAAMSASTTANKS